jgi:hypothetical protein
LLSDLFARRCDEFGTGAVARSHNACQGGCCAGDPSVSSGVDSDQEGGRIELVVPAAFF